MRFMVMVKATRESEAGVMPTGAEFVAIGAFNEQLVKAGVTEAGEGLHRSARGVRVAFSGTDRRVIEGPFAATSAAGRQPSRRCCATCAGVTAAGNRPRWPLTDAFLLRRPSCFA